MALYETGTQFNAAGLNYFRMEIETHKAITHSLVIAVDFLCVLFFSCRFCTREKIQKKKYNFFLFSLIRFHSVALWVLICVLDFFLFLVRQRERERERVRYTESVHTYPLSPSNCFNQWNVSHTQNPIENGYLCCQIDIFLRLRFSFDLMVVLFFILFYFQFDENVFSNFCFSFSINVFSPSYIHTYKYCVVVVVFFHSNKISIQSIV